MTRFFPAVLSLLIIGGLVIAYFVISNDDGDGPDFVGDIAGGVEATDLLSPIAFLIPVMAFVIGASSIGADLKSGMVEQILTWEPRRLRFLAARCVAGFIGAALAAIFVSVVYVAGTFVLAAVTGTTSGTTGELWGNIAVAVVRSGAASGLFAIFGIGITVLVNSSVASIVGFVIYFFIIENLFQVFLPKISTFLPVTNTSAFAAGIDVQRIEGSAFDENVELIVSHGYLTAGVILAAYTIGSTIVSGVLFRQRDIA